MMCVYMEHYFIEIRGLLSTPYIIIGLKYLYLPSVGSHFRTEKAYVRGLAGGAFNIRPDNQFKNNQNIFLNAIKI